MDQNAGEVSCPIILLNRGEPEESIPGQMTIEDFLGGLKDGGEKDMS